MPVRLHDQGGLTLVELLIGMIVMGVISTMLLLTWFSLNNSYSYSVRSYEARDNARLAVSRMQREIRDAQSPANGIPAVLHAQSNWIELYTTFNEAGNADPLLTPRLVVYRLYGDGTMWRFADGHNGTAGIQGVKTTGGFDPATLGSAEAQNEQANGEGASLVLNNVVNATAQSTVAPFFQYSTVDGNGTVTFQSDITASIQLAEVLGVRLHMLVDLNPGKAPIYVDFTTLAQLRNQRTF